MDKSKVSNEILRDVITLKRTELQIHKTHVNLGEPWNALRKFFENNLIDLLEELLAYREGKIANIKDNK